VAGPGNAAQNQQKKHSEKTPEIEAVKSVGGWIAGPRFSTQDQGPWLSYHVPLAPGYQQILHNGRVVPGTTKRESNTPEERKSRN